MTLFVLSLPRGPARRFVIPAPCVSTRELPEYAGRRECTGRGYKYGDKIAELKLDHYDEDEDGPLDEIIRAMENGIGAMNETAPTCKMQAVDAPIRHLL